MKERDTILIVDDMEVNRAILCGLFEGEYKILEAENGLQAMELLEAAQASIAVMLLDIVMPEMDGYQVLREMMKRKFLSSVPVVVITSEASAESELHAFDFGASDIVTKPFEPHLVLRRVKNIIELYRHKLFLEDMVEEQAARLRDSNDVLTDALSAIIEYRSLESGRHIRRIRMFTKILMQRVCDTYPEYRLDAAQIDAITRASAMHDIGKIAIPDAILNKPGKLTAAEYEVMKSHTTYGCEMLANLERMNDRQYLEYAYQICRYHHERWDGRGYPDGLMGDAIPLCAQVVGIADCYDALTTDRVYKAAFPHEKAVAMILKGDCGVFYAKLLECFKDVNEPFAALANDYADGRFIPADKNLVHRQWEPHTCVLNQSELWHKKYNALLKYRNVTVIQTDLNTGEYQIAYTPTTDFDFLRGDGLLGDAMQYFIENSVHPGDRERMRREMGQNESRIFAGKFVDKPSECRVFSREAGTYRLYRCTPVRIDAGAQALLLWENIKEEAPHGSQMQSESRDFFHAMDNSFHAVFVNNLSDDIYTVIRPSEGQFDLKDYPLSYTKGIEQEAMQMIHPDDRPFFLGEYDIDHMRAYFAENEQKVLRYRRRAPSGAFCIVNAICVRSHSTHDENLVVYTFLLSAGDGASEMRVSPALLGNDPSGYALSESERTQRELGRLIDALPSGILQCVGNPTLQILRVNKAFCSMFGYTREEIKTIHHDSFASMICPRDRDYIIKDAHRRVQMGLSFEQEYRITGKDGRLVWVTALGCATLLQGGERSFCAVLIDVTGKKETKEELRLTLERHKIIMDQTNDIIFEWDIGEDAFMFSSNWENKFGYKPLSEQVSRRIVSESHIHPDDQPAFIEILSSIKQGQPYKEADIRMKLTAVSYLWCKVRMTAQYDEAGRAIKAVGVILDINDEKCRTEELLEKAQRDALTQLYNKGTVQRMIKQYLDEKEPDAFAAIFIIDIDDFKNINDTRGHLFGDAFLSEIAHEIQQQFRTADAVGRIGGDEFIVCLKDIPDRSVAEKKAQLVLKVFHTVTIRSALDCKTSCSIGIALCPDHGNIFNDLYRKADIALYRAKKQGKNQYVIYDADATQQMLEDLPKRGADLRHTAIDSDGASLIFGNSLIKNIFHILNQSTDIEAAVQTILEIVGHQFDASRAYIYENLENDRYCVKTFEWRAEEENQACQIPQHGSYKEQFGEEYREFFDENGVFYCRDTSTLPEAPGKAFMAQKIKSLLQRAIYDDGRFCGFVGFDECRENRYWTQEQVDTLTFVAEILSTFLLRKRAQDRQSRFALEMRTILDSQNAWIYVIRPHTYELLFINKKAKQLVPELFPGMRCYEALPGYDAPCASCPAADLGEGCSSCIKDVYHPKQHMWTTADASRILWRGEEAILLCCHKTAAQKAREDAGTTV